MEKELQEEEERKLKERVMKLESELMVKILTIRNQQKRLTQYEEEKIQLMDQKDDLLQKLAKHQRTGIPYYNRTLECISVRLKMPQFTCITLQPLIEAHPEIEMIIAEKVKQGFYEDMIELQNFLMMSFHMGSYRGVSITQEYFWYQG